MTALGKTEEPSVCLLPGPVGSPVPGPGDPEERASQPEARQLICVSTAEVSEEDQILLLITCVGDDDERLVVAAVRIKQ